MSDDVRFGTGFMSLDDESRRYLAALTQRDLLVAIHGRDAGAIECHETRENTDAPRQDSDSE